MAERKKIALIAERTWAWLKKTRQPLRSGVMVIMAGFAAWLISLLVSIPIRILMERILGSPEEMSVAALATLAALSLDLPKAVALAAVGFFFGRFMAARPWPAAVGLTVAAYSFDTGLVYVMGLFEMEWAHKYALAGRLPLMVLIVALTVCMTWWGSKLRVRREQAAPARTSGGKVPPEAGPDTANQ